MDYCRNDTSQDFEQKLLVEILQNLRKFDKRTLKTKPMMARARKRVVFGAIETKKSLELGKVKAIIVARNLQDLNHLKTLSEFLSLVVNLFFLL